MSTPETLLAEWRTGKNIGPKSASVEVGVDRVTWWRWETGASRVSFDKLDRVERITGIPRQKLRPDIFGEVA